MAFAHKVIPFVLAFRFGSASFEQDVIAPVSFERRLSSVKGMFDNFGASGGRRLQAVLSDDCKTKCPGMDKAGPVFMAAYVEFMGSKDAEMTKVANLMDKMCPHAEQLKCSAETAECQDSGKVPATKTEDQKGMECMCACPTMVKMVRHMGGGAMDKMYDVACQTEGSTEKLKYVECLNKNKDVCFKTKLDWTEQGKTSDRENELNCISLKKGCNKKMESMATCKGFTKWMTDGCDPKLKGSPTDAEKDACCPLFNDIGECLTKECVTIAWAVEMENKEFEKGSKKLMTNCAGKASAAPTMEEITAVHTPPEPQDTACGWVASAGWALLVGLVSSLVSFA